MDEDFLSTGRLAELVLLASLAAFMLAWEMSLETAVRSKTCKDHNHLPFNHL